VRLCFCYRRADVSSDNLRVCVCLCVCVEGGKGGGGLRMGSMAPKLGNARVQHVLEGRPLAAVIQKPQ